MNSLEQLGHFLDYCLEVLNDIILVLKVNLVQHAIYFADCNTRDTVWAIVGHVQSLFVAALLELYDGLLGKVFLYPRNFCLEPGLEHLLISVNDYFNFWRLQEVSDVIVSNVVALLEVVVLDLGVDYVGRCLMELPHLVHHLFLDISIELLLHVGLVALLLVNHHVFKAITSVNVCQASSHASLCTYVFLQIICIRHRDSSHHTCNDSRRANHSFHHF